MSVDAAPAPAPRPSSGALTVLAIVVDEATRALFTRIVTRDRLLVSADLNEGLALAESSPPDVAFVEIGINGGAGLAMVHHLKALFPGVTILALAARTALEAAANAVALGGAGLVMLPIAGDEILSAIAAAKAAIAQRQLRADLDQASIVFSRAAAWMTRLAELADATSRNAAAQQLVEVLIEATGAAGAAVYLTVGDKPTELVRAAVSPALERAPAFGMEADVVDHARRERLLVVPLATRSIKAGQVLLTQPASGSGASGPHSLGGLAPRAAAGAEPASSVKSAAPQRYRIDGLVKMLATQAATAFGLLHERDRAGGSAIKDPSSSAYSFAYYVDVAGREIDKARRYGRRFAIATVAYEPDAASAGAAQVSPAEIADSLLKAARDTDVLARVDEREFHLLMPETDGLGAHAARRRILARLADKSGRVIPAGLLVGAATFPHDGHDLSQLLRIARRRADATRDSIVHRLGADQAGLADLLEALDWEVRTPSPEAICAPRPLELALPEAAALATTVVADALRGGATILTVAHHDKLSLGAAVRASLGPTRDNVTVHALDVSALPGGEAVEALSVIAEHGAYALIGRADGGVLRGLHAADPLLADLLAERLGRAAGLRIFT